MPYPNNQVRIRDGTVTPITVPEDQLEELMKVLESKNYSTWRKDAMKKQVVGGTCCVCHEVPSMQVSYSLEGATQYSQLLLTVLLVGNYR